MMKKETVIVTGGAGFIGSELVRFLVNKTNHQIINIDKLTYAGDQESLDSIKNSTNYIFKKTDICNMDSLQDIFYEFKPTKVIHLAAESHVDRSISNPSSFVETNILGTFNLLECFKSIFYKSSKKFRNLYRFHHISTDEVFGDLYGHEALFTENSNYDPSSPYSASKAASDHLVRAWGRTYELPYLITNCSNNFGPYQNPEKFIPKTIISCIEKKPITIFGDGSQVRDWLYVQDHIDAINKICWEGNINSTYLIGGSNELRNIDVVHSICNYFNKTKFHKNFDCHSLIKNVADRPGHDRRYAIDASKLLRELDFNIKKKFSDRIVETIEWYISNKDWWQSKVKL